MDSQTISNVLPILNMILTILLGIYVVQEKGKINKKLKSFVYDRKDIGGLHTKIHDRMNEIIAKIKSGTTI